MPRSQPVSRGRPPRLRQLPGPAAGTERGQQRRSPGPAARAASGAALRDLIDDPCQLATVRSWLRPEHLTHAASGRLMRCCWKWTLLGSRLTPSPLPGQRASADWGPTGAAGRGDRSVRRRKCPRGAAAGHAGPVTDAGIAIQRDAGDPQLDPSRLILAAARRLDSVRDGPTRQPGQADALAAPRLGRAAAGQAEPEAAR